MVELLTERRRMIGQAEPETMTYLGFRVVLLDERHLTIYAPDGRRIVADVCMTISGARRVICGYRRACRLDEPEGTEV